MTIETTLLCTASALAASTACEETSPLRLTVPTTSLVLDRAQGMVRFFSTISSII